MKLKILLCLFGMAAVILAAEAVRMEARVYTERPEQARAKLGDLFGELDICTVSRTDDGRDFLVINTNADQLARIEAAGLRVEITWPDIREKFRKMTGVDPLDLDAGRNFGYFFTYWEMIDTLRRLAALYPLIVDTFKLGPTFQNRVIWGLRISDNPTVDEPEPELFINGATHAREPMGTHACVNFASLLCQGYGSDSMVTWLVRNREFYIIPVVNPDGYVYNSDSGGASSNWRKSRRGPVPPAIGVDLNRNYGYKWGYDDIGSSPTPSSETYRGPSRFSELETQSIRGLLNTHEFRTCQDFHTYGRYNLYAWGYMNPMPPDSLVLNEMGETLMANNGYTQTGPIYRTIYSTNGGSTDYAQADTLKDSTSESKFITYGFSSELGRTDFWYGWNLPAYVDSEVNKNIPNLYYLAGVSGVFFDSMRVAVNDSAQGNRTNQLDPNETADLWFRVKNRAIHPLDSAYSISGRLRSLDTMVTVLDSIKAFPSCRRRDSTDNRAAQFRVYCKKGASPGRVVPLRLELTYMDDTLTMMQPVSFTITIGANPIYDHDVGCTRLLAPVGAVDSGASVVPACSVYNYGDVAESYVARMRIGVYDQTADVVNHTAGSWLYVTFPDWTAGARGTYAVSCSTELASDTIRGNDKRTGSVMVIVSDVACARILAPTDTVPYGTPVTPQARVKNLGSASATFTAKFSIGGTYAESVTVTNLAAGDSLTVDFPSWGAGTVGTVATRCSTRMSGDQVAANDRASSSVFVRLTDVSVMGIFVPPGSGMADSGAIVTPRCTVVNYGNTVPDSFDVDLHIGSSYFCTGRAPGSGGGVVFPKPCTLAGRGWCPMRCSTKLVGDQLPSDDRKRDSVFLRVRDIGAVRVTSPVGAILPGPVIPSADVHNWGNLREACKVYFGINSSPAYIDSVVLPDGLPCADTNLSFTNWTAVGGVYTARCSAALTGDMEHANDTASARFVVGTIDAAVTALLSPVSADTSVLQIPSAKVKNFGTAPAAGVKAIFNIDSTPGDRVYLDTVTVDIGAGVELTVTFDTWPKPYKMRTYVWKCKVVAQGDGNPANDSLTGTFVEAAVPPGWYEKTPMPAGAKAIKDGGWLAYDVSMVRIYASRGQKQPDFFAYAPVGDFWGARAPWLPGTEGKLPGKGSAGCADGNGIIYATKGNNKSGFYKYDANADAWTQLKDVPLGLSNKKVKGGTDIVWALKGGVGYPYLLKGYKNEFYRYDTGEDSWQTLAPAPVGSNQKWDKGSWLAHDGVKTIYAHKAKYHELWKYDTETDAWDPTALVAMPIPGSAGSKKSKDGGCGTYLGAAIYALKGGNTQEFWKYTVATNSWVEKETIPAVGVTGKKKKVKAGADIVALGTDLYATKGNKANELWMYTPGAFVAVPMPEREGVTSSSFLVPRSSFIVSPNPLASGFVVLRYGLPKAGVAWLRVYNVTGQTVMTQTLVAGRSGVVNVDLRHLSNGVYVVRFASEGFECSQKLVVQR